MVKGKSEAIDFFSNVCNTTYDALESKCDLASLPVEMVRRARQHNAVTNVNYACGFDAFKCCSHMLNYMWTSPPTIKNYDHMSFCGATWGPKPSQYYKFLQRWVRDDLIDRIYNSDCSWEYCEDLIIKNLRAGNAVIGFGNSRTLSAHYFPIVGWGNKVCCVLDNNGDICTVEKGYLKWYMNASLPGGVKGYSVYLMSRC